jgi:hypothetical protein
MSRWSRSVIWVGVAGSAVALATLVAVVVVTDPLGGGAGPTTVVVATEGLPHGQPAQSGQGSETKPGWRVSLRPGSTVDLDTGDVVERSDSVAIGADLVFDTSLRLVSAVGSAASSRGGRLSMVKDVSAWQRACEAARDLDGRAGLVDTVDARKLPVAALLCARTTGGRLMLLRVDAVPTPSKPVLSLELRRTG